MGFRHLQTSDTDGVRRITIQRPDKLNALNRETLTELQVAFGQARDDDAVRVVVLAGSGEKAFVAGADIAELASLDAAGAQAFSAAGQRLMRGIEQLGKPVIARVQGFALGGGMELAMACHLRIAADTARFGQPEINLGLIPGFGGTQRLLRLAGRAAALEMCLLGAPIDATRAQQLGIVNRVVPGQELDAEVDRVATQLARSSAPALAATLDAVINGGECGAEEGLAYETRAFALLFAGADMREGTQAFLDRRKPKFA